MILIVDDEVETCELINQLLQDNGLDATYTSSPFEAISKFNELPIDLLIIDLKMEGMNGFQLLEELKLSDPHVKALVLTAYYKMENVVKALRTGYVDFFDKDMTTEIDFSEFINRVKYLLYKKDADKVISLLKQRKEISVVEISVILNRTEQQVFELIEIINYSTSEFKIELSSKKGYTSALIVEGK